jgi:hypothetical protein
MTRGGSGLVEEELGPVRARWDYIAPDIGGEDFSSGGYRNMARLRGRRKAHRRKGAIVA